MRYGKSGAQEIDATLRRRSDQKLKSAAPGAPFGWCSDGTPYIGTQYCVKQSARGLQFASLSTRNGRAQYYWKSLSELSPKVALSALETHGRVEELLANESRLPIGEVFELPQLSAVKAVFRRLVGAQVLSQFEAAGGDDEPDSNASAKATPSAEGISVKSEGGASGSKVVGQKRLARMAAVDELRGVAAAAAPKKAKSAPAIDEPPARAVKADIAPVVKTEVASSPAVRPPAAIVSPPAGPSSCDARSDSSGSPPPDDDDDDDDE